MCLNRHPPISLGQAFCKNLQGDILSIYDTNGTCVASYKYNAWGECSVSNYTSAAIGNINPFRYRGYYYDIETDLYYLNARYYDPYTKRFINADTLDNLGANGDLNAFNLYAYCSNNPVMYVDPTGEYCSAFAFVAVCLIILCIDLAISADLANSNYYNNSNLENSEHSTNNTLIDSQIQYSNYEYGFGNVGKNGCEAIAIHNSLILSDPHVQEAIVETAEAVIDAVNDTVDFVVEAVDNIQDKTKEKSTVIAKNNDNKARFTADPYNFNPKGLVRNEYPGTKNGRIIKWTDPVTGTAIFEWNEDLKNGSHYHVLQSGKHTGDHRLPGEVVPEPLNSIYFGG